MTDLWQYDKYLTSNNVMINTDIFEYDIRSANTSLAKEYKLLPDSMITKLEALPKRERVVEVGLYKRDHREYNELEKAAFADARRRFFHLNNIDSDRVISIKRDAIFLEGRVLITKITNNIEFRMKNEYTSFMNLKPLEIYYTTGKPLDVKGMGVDVYLEKHHDYFGGCIEGMFARFETLGPKYVYRYLRDITDRYKWRELPVEYYREFNALSRYLYKDGQTYDIVTDIDSLDISYNFNLLLKIVGLLL